MHLALSQLLVPIYIFHNIYYVAHIHMEKSRGEKSCLILSSKPSSFTWKIYIMWLIYTWKRLEEKSHVLSSLANHLASQGEYYVAHIHMEKSRGQKSCLILSCKPFSFTRIISCGSYTHGKVYKGQKSCLILSSNPSSFARINIMWFIYTWKSLEGKSPIWETS